MKAYLVVFTQWNTECKIHGFIRPEAVFSTREKAEEYIRSVSSNFTDVYRIQEWQIDRVNPNIPHGYIA
jgi:hypothetical protein